MINPEIVFSLKSPQVADPLQQASQAVNLIGGVQRARAGAQELEQGALQLQQQKQEIADNQALRDLASEHGPDFDKIVAGAAGRVSPKALASLQQAATEHKVKMQAMRKEELENLDRQNKLVTNESGALAALPPDQQAAQYAGARARLIQQGLAKPGELPEQYPGPEAVARFHEIHAGWEKVYEHNLKLKGEERAAADDLRKAEKANQDAIAAGAAIPGVQADSELKVLKAAGKEPIQPAEQARIDQAAKPNSAADLALIVSNPKLPQADRDVAQAALKVLEKHAIAGRPVTNVSVLPNADPKAANLKGDEFLATLPTGMAAQVKAITEGRSGIPGAQSRSPDAQKIRNAVFQFDPTFTEQRAQVRRAFTAGPDGKNIGALNTAIVHLGRLGDTAEALNNGSFTPGNEFYNWARDKFGSEKVTNFSLLKDAVAGEMAAALKGNATDVEIEKMGKSIRASNSPDQMRGVIQEGMAILNDKANTYSERYHALLPDDPWTPILPSAKANLDKHSVKSPAPQGTPQKGAKRSYGGHEFMFSGTDWVKQ